MDDSKLSFVTKTLTNKMEEFNILFIYETEKYT